MASFVKKTLKKAHGTLVERLCQKAATASSQNPTPGTSPNGSISSHTGAEEGPDVRITTTDNACASNRSSNRFSGEHVYARRYSQQQQQPPPPPTYENSQGQQKYIPYRKPVPLPAGGGANGWAGVHRQSPAELQ